MNKLFPDGKELKGLIPNATKGFSKTVLGGSLAGLLAVSYTHLTLPTTPYV